MEEIKLDVTVRKEIGGRQVKDVRKNDLIPGVIYGGEEKETLIKFDRRTFEHIRRLHAGESIVFHINVMEADKKPKDYSALVVEEQHDSVSDKILHIDFKRISLTEKIEVKVPIIAKGDPIGVTKDGGSLDHILWELDVECLPTDIPQHIDIDVSALNIGDTIHVKDVQLPLGVITPHDPEAIIFSVVPPMKEEEEKPAEGEEEVEPELIKEKKEGEPEEEQPPAAAEEKKEE